MKISRYNALRLWEEFYGSSQYAEDFHGNLMCKDGYGDSDFSVYYYGKNILRLEYSSHTSVSLRRNKCEKQFALHQYCDE